MGLHDSQDRCNGVGTADITLVLLCVAPTAVDALNPVLFQEIVDPMNGDVFLKAESRVGCQGMNDFLAVRPIFNICI